MSGLVAGAVALATDPTPNPTEGTLRPGLESWQVSPGLVGFLVTFVLAVACVLLFLNMSKHLRRAGHNARVQGLPIAAPEGIAFRRTDGEPEFGSADSSASPDAGASGASGADSSPSGAGPTGRDRSGGSGG